ncbi:hypothetical protein ACFQFC_10410 [Amorphoplanes digitatis]|uniref:hypothetical protein n=1 Tax=Actinoplanes digitatis TaxID=1868 RepID=UPI003615C06A
MVFAPAGSMLSVISPSVTVARVTEPSGAVISDGTRLTLEYASRSTLCPGSVSVTRRSCASYPNVLTAPPNSDRITLPCPS